MDVTIPDNLEDLKRNKLQSLCKIFKIPANLKNVELIRRLEEVRQLQSSDNQEQQVTCNENDAESGTPVVTSPPAGDSRLAIDEELSKDDHTVCNDNVYDDVVMVTASEQENISDANKKGTSNRRRRRIGQGRKQRRGKKAKTTTSGDDVAMNDDCVVEDHVITHCPEGSDDGSHGDSSIKNAPPIVFTPANDIINEDNVISSSARRRRKCWSEVQHRESIEELFDRMTSSTNTPPVVDMDTDEVTGVAGEHTEDEEHDRRENCCDVEEQQTQDDDVVPPKKRRRRSTFDVESPTVTSNDITSVQANNTIDIGSCTRSSLTNQFMKKKNSSTSLFTEQSLSPLVTNSQSSTLVVNDDDKVKEEVTAMLEDRVKLRKSNSKAERGGASIAGHKRKTTHSVAPHNSKIPVPKCAKSMTAKDFDKIHQKNFKRSQSILDYHNRKQQQLSSVTPLTNSSSVNKSYSTSVKSSTTSGYPFKPTKPQLNHTVSSSTEVFRFKATPSSTANDKRHRETVERRKSYNAQGSAKKKPRYKPYTGKLPPLQPIRNY